MTRTNHTKIDESTRRAIGEAEVMFYLGRGGGWTFEAETIGCRLLDGGCAEVVGVPMYLTGVSRGDVVRIHHDGAGLVGSDVLRSGGHSTVHVVAARGDLLNVITTELAGTGVTVLSDPVHPVLAVDVPPEADLAEVRTVLETHVSADCNYAVSCDRHPASVERLRARVRGEVVAPGDADWDTARQAWNLAIDQRPWAVVFAESARDVAATVRFAAAYGLEVAPQSGGHNAEPLGDLSATVLLRMARMRSVQLDADRRLVRVEAGVLWGDVTAALAGRGLAALSGSSADVGVAGYTLSGGYSWLGRRYGLAANHVTALEVVTGDGQIRTIDAENEPELFWAVRGGGGNGAVVSALEFRVFPVDTVYAGSLLFPLERAREVFGVFAEWSADLDERVTACVRLLRFPPLPELPDFLRGQSFAVIDGAIDADTQTAEMLLSRLRALGPAVDLWGPMPATELGHIHMDPPAPTPCAGNGLVLTELSDETIDAILAVAGPGRDTSLLAVDVRLLGGAIGRPVAGGGAVDHLPGRYLLFAVGVTPTPEAHAAVAAEVATLLGRLAPWQHERMYANFSESSEPASRFHAPEVLERLRAVQDAVDPRRVIRANHPLR